MSNPYTTIDEVVVNQLRQFTALTALVPASRIRFPEKTVDIAKWMESADTKPTIFIVPGQVPYSPFANATDHDRACQYEIVIDSPDSKMANMREIQYQIERAIAGYLLDHLDVNGVLLDNPTPFEWLQPTLSQFVVTIEPESKRIQWVARLSIRTKVTTDDLRGAETAPAFKELVLCVNNAATLARLFMFFDKPIEPTAYADAIGFIRDGTGRRWSIETNGMSAGKNTATFPLQWPHASQSGAVLFTYGAGSPNLAGTNGLDVEDASNVTLPMTIVEV